MKLVRVVLAILVALCVAVACSTSPNATPPRSNECSPACGTGEVCFNGSCTCGSGLNQCSTGCKNLLADPANCGTCGNACPMGQFCSTAACSAACALNLTACGQGCVDLSTDTFNCGACGTNCATGQTCSGSVCQGSTPTGTGGTGGGVGGASNGGSGTGATANGGAAQGGAAQGGAAQGGAAQGGAAQGGSGTGGSTSTGDPPGYWRFGDWHGCSWTGVGTDGTSNVVPQDFIAKPAADPYCVSGTVGAEPEYKSVALLGFNVNEPNSVTCEYKPVDTTADGPPETSPLSDGIAVDFVKRGANTGFTLRVQLQGKDGAKEGAVGEADRWCATITEVQGKVFVPYSSFTPSCWEMTEAARGTPYAGQPIDAVVFLVPGALTDTPFDFCVNGFAYGTSAADAPDGPATGGDQMGTVGGSNNDELDFDRKKVNVGGENYIIQNNNWGNPSGSDCILSYLNNSFTVTTCTGTGSSAPAAFPSIYVGANGNTANGVLSTSSTDNLPIAISSISRIDTTFRYSGSGGSHNAAYDIWFANSPPSGEYKDGINGFAMVWLRDPGDKQPVGSQMGGAMTIAGQSWNVWVGPRGAGPEGDNPAPVVSFVNPTQDDDSRSQSFVNQNLLEFINAATTVNGGLSGSMYLTDIFAGFEIWSGGTGLKVDEFKVDVVKK